MVKFYIYILHSALSTILQLTRTFACTSRPPLRPPDALHSSSRLHRPCAYHEQCGLENEFPFLFVGHLKGPGLTCSTKHIQVILFLFINHITVFPHRRPLSLSLPRPPPSFTMNIHIDAVLNTIIYNESDYIPYIIASVSLNPEAVHLQMEEINQDIQASTSNYLINTPTTNTNILIAYDEKIKYIKAFLQLLHIYPEPPTTPSSQFFSPTT